MPAYSLPLSIAVDKLYYGASCEDCKRTIKIDLHAMLERLGPDARVEEIRPKLVCKLCGGHNIIACTLWKDATTTPALMERWG